MELNFVAAAVLAREVGVDPPRVFVTLVRDGWWQNITHAQEESARQALAMYRETFLGGFGFPRPNAGMDRDLETGRDWQVENTGQQTSNGSAYGPSSNIRSKSCRPLSTRTISTSEPSWNSRLKIT